jgi:hypothetical protein
MPLIERRDGRFTVRERSEIARLVKYSFPDGVAVDGLMPGLARIAAALNANDHAAARIAAVHLQIPDLPGPAARNAMIAEDALIKYAQDQSGDNNWNPALHPRAGVPPNPGWFAPVDGGPPSHGELRPRFAENVDPSRRTDAAASHADWVRLPPREDRIDELADFLEWFANAKPEDEKALRHEIKRYFYDVGNRIAGDQLTAALAHVIDPNVDRETRQEILNDLEIFSRSDPTIAGQIETLVYLGLSFFLPGSPPKTTRGGPKSPEVRTVEPSPAEAAAPVELARGDAPSKIWSYGWARRGQEIHILFGDKSLPPGFPVIDNFTDGIATSIKSIDLRAATYQDAARLTHRLEKYVNSVSDFVGRTWANNEVRFSDIQGRALQLIVPKGSLTAIQRDAIEAVGEWARSKNNNPVKIIITEF